MIDLERRVKNSMLYWFPRIEKLDIPKPRTIIVKVDPRAMFEWIAGKKPLPGEYIEKFYEAADKVGYPLFVRSDHTSNKHDYENSCYVEKREDLLPHISNIVEFTLMIDIIGAPTNAIIFREFLEIPHVFKAFRGLPIGREFRFFSDGEKVLKHLFYWPDDAIERGWHKYPLPEDWRERLRKLRKLSDVEYRKLSSWAVMAAEACGDIWPRWSIDFAYTTRGWVLIDMAVAEDSWGWGDEIEEE